MKHFSYNSSCNCWVILHLQYEHHIKRSFCEVTGEPASSGRWLVSTGCEQSGRWSLCGADGGSAAAPWYTPALLPLLAAPGIRGKCSLFSSAVCCSSSSGYRAPRLQSQIWWRPGMESWAQCSWWSHHLGRERKSLLLQQYRASSSLSEGWWICVWNKF